MSCVLITVVMLNSLVISMMSLSITILVWGPGRCWVRRRINILDSAQWHGRYPPFFIPPLISAGIFIGTGKVHLASTSFTRFLVFHHGFYDWTYPAGTLRFVPPSCCQTNAPPWKTSRSAGAVPSAPYHPCEENRGRHQKISPSSGSNNPTRHFCKTVLPLPLVPMIRLHLPVSITWLTSLQHGFIFEGFLCFERIILIALIYTNTRITKHPLIG